MQDFLEDLVLSDTVDNERASDSGLIEDWKNSLEYKEFLEWRRGVESSKEVRLPSPHCLQETAFVFPEGTFYVTCISMSSEGRGEMCLNLELKCFS